MTIDVHVAPERVMLAAIRGALTKHALATLLAPPARRAFYDACGGIEARYTEACRAKGDPCLESGCSAEGERCLQPLLEAGGEYYRACGREWTKLFADEANRDSFWLSTLADYNLEKL